MSDHRHAEINALMADLAHARLVKRTRGAITKALDFLPRASRRALLVDLLLEVEPTKGELARRVPRPDPQGPEPVWYRPDPSAAPEPPLGSVSKSPTTPRVYEAIKDVLRANFESCMKVAEGATFLKSATEEELDRLAGEMAPPGGTADWAKSEPGDAVLERQAPVERIEVLSPAPIRPTPKGWVHDNRLLTEDQRTEYLTRERVCEACRTSFEKTIGKSIKPTPVPCAQCGDPVFVGWMVKQRAR